MPKGVFPQFMNALAAAWSAQLPRVARSVVASSPLLPRASTFYAGTEPRHGRHVFLVFQHNSKPWKVGSFTVSLLLSDRKGLPAEWAHRDPGELREGHSGFYRLGTLVHGKDKWWLLEPLEFRLVLVWRATDYADRDAVFAAAIEDVTSDVKIALGRLGIDAAAA